MSHDTDFLSENDCPPQCNCISYSKCDWSIQLLKKIEDARGAQNGKLFNAYNKEFREHICNFQEQTVCCCGPEQKPPNESYQFGDPLSKENTSKVSGMCFVHHKFLKVPKHSTLFDTKCYTPKC